LASTTKAFVNKFPPFHRQACNPKVMMMTTTTATATTSSDSAPALPDIAPSAKRLFLVRHGEVINPGGDRAVYYGAMDVPLSPLGEDEAKAAGRYLSRFDLQAVASSPLSRAMYGAQQVMDRQVPVMSDMLVLEGFRELQRGAWQGKTKDEITPELMARFDACDETVTPEGGESFPTLKDRALKARDAVLERTGVGRASAVVSHLQVTRSILSDALGIPTSQMAALKVATASVTCIDYDASSGTQTVHFQSFKPDAGLVASRDGAN
jgi:broad specificity phosphatase PhoE